MARIEHQLDDVALDSPTLIEGFPGVGLVGKIIVDHLIEQLEMTHYANVHCEGIPPVATYQPDSSELVTPVRLYVDSDRELIALQSDVPIPPNAFGSLSQCVLSDVAEEFERAVFLAGAPAESETSSGEVIGIATTDRLETALTDAGITLAEGSGVVGGVTGALVAECYREDVPAAVLIVRSNPYIPDPGAAHSVIEDALEPLVEFDIDTQKLLEQAEEIQQQKKQIAEQLQQYQQQEEQQAQTAGMYQ